MEIDETTSGCSEETNEATNGCYEKIEVDSTNDQQLMEIENRTGSDERLLPVHFLPEGRQCYDWINKDLESKSKISSPNPHTKRGTTMINSVTYSSANMNSPVGIPPEKDDLHILLKAAEDGNLETITHILKKCPSLISLTDGDGYTALHRASYSGHLGVLLFLLEHGANVNAKTHDGWEPLHCATRWNNLDVCKLLLEHHADINATTKGLQTPLHFAALSVENKSILEMFLLNKKINVNVTNAAGDTPYDLAYRNGPQVKLFDMVHDGLKI